MKLAALYSPAGKLLLVNPEQVGCLRLPRDHEDGASVLIVQGVHLELREPIEEAAQILEAPRE